jgi:hypothetical protein
MENRRPVDLKTKAGRAVRAARIGIDLIRTAAFGDRLDASTHEEIERHIREQAPDMLPMLDYIRRCPPEARQTVVDALADKFENALHFAATRNPGFEIEAEELRREYVKYNMGLDPGAVSNRPGSA